MLHESHASSFVCLFVCLSLAMSFCLMYTDYLVELAQRSNAYPSGEAPCIILLTDNWMSNAVLCVYYFIVSGFDILHTFPWSTWVAMTYIVTLTSKDEGVD